MIEPSLIAYDSFIDLDEVLYQKVALHLNLLIEDLMTVL